MKSSYKIFMNNFLVQTEEAWKVMIVCDYD